MPPVENDPGREQIRSRIKELVDSSQVLVFSKSYCPYCVKVKELFKELNVKCNAVELDLMEDGTNYQDLLHEMTGQKTVPNVFINKKHIGGCDNTLKAHKDGVLQQLLGEGSEVYDYDLIVIGGGSGGLASSKEAAILGKKVMVLDYVIPTPKGTTWGLGGTCVNVGCIPKKLMHQTALLGTAMQDARKFGWEFSEQVTHNWDTMKTAVNNYIGSLNWGYRVSLRDKNVNYVNSYAEFVEPHKIKATNKRGKEMFYTASKFILATGERPRYLGIPGDKEYCITSDDLFSLSYCPGKTLVIGASYVALECGGFLAGLGLDVTVMVRSILLRGFDQDMANRAGDHMETHGVKFIRKFVPVKIEELEAGTPGRLKVTAKSTESDEIIEGEYNTVLIAVGRDACTGNIGLDKAGVKVNPKNGKIPVNDEEQTNVPHIYAIGDILEGKWELTPVAIQAGKLLARRFFAGSSLKCDYVNVPTTVFTPMEYGSCGYAEEKAVEI
ncbi:thioredoxin reductase 3 [Triplophysa rosa]|uniref:thioredoxin reductase 3 n=1 Tax=Triplophysa rosa TaxID=992332 RepID=UPI002545E4F4|nr:thioredoxin reductase 3 [Triplophysa rosa]